MNSDRIIECTELAGTILKNIELSELPLSNIILKCLRLCRLLGDDEGIEIFTYESSGYPSSQKGLTSESLRIARIMGRAYYKKSKEIIEKEEPKEYVRTSLVAEIENTINSSKIHLNSAADRQISISSANPHQFIMNPQSNAAERYNVVLNIQTQTALLETVKGKIYSYILAIYNKLSYGNIVEELFTQSRITVNDKLSSICPAAIEKFVTVYNNMDSSVPEDWANAVHSCRRILSEFADSLYPPSETPICINGKTIKVGKEQYINRLIQFINNNSESTTYGAVVGSHLESIGNRIDAINNAVCKGTHAEVSKWEASRYIIHTYLLISDILSLND